MPTGKTNDKPRGHIDIDQALCKGCLLCISFCPRDSISESNALNDSGYSPVSFLGDGQCTGCAICALVCPEVAIEVYRD